MSSAFSNLNLFLKLAVAATVAILVVQYIARGPAYDPRRHAGVGEKLGDVGLERLTDDPLADDSWGGMPAAIDSRDLAGRVALVNFWATWCGPCRRELPHLVALKERLANRPDFLLVAVSCNDADEDLNPLRQTTEEYLRAVHLNVTTYADPGAATRGRLKKTAGMTGYPFTLAIDRQGVIRGVWDGYYPGAENDMETLIQELLDDGKVAAR